MWEWEKTDSPTLFQTGYIDGAAVSGDGGRIFSVTHDGFLRIWNGNDGSRIDEFYQGSAAISVAISPDDLSVAIGFRNGNVKVRGLPHRRPSF